MHDSHVHLTIQPLYDYLDQALENFVNNGGKYILSTSSEIQDCYETLDVYSRFKHKYPKLLQNAIGIHPERYADKVSNAREEIKELKQILRENHDNIHAIGETGLEYFNLLNRNDLSFDQKEEIIETQKMSFREHIHIAIENDLPMTIHTRDEFDSDYCTKDMVAILLAEGKMKIRGCMHCYVGTEKYLMDLLDMGFYIGYNAILTYKSGENVRALLEQTPIEKILLETDAPFLPPQSVRKNKTSIIKFGQPSDILEIAKAVSEIKNIKLEEVLNKTTENYEKLFNPLR